MKPIRLLLVEDHIMMRAALRLLLLGYPNVEVIAETESCEGALDLMSREHPDVLLLDVFLFDHSSIECIPSLRTRSPQTRILMLTGVTDVVLHQRAMAAGAQGVVRKDESPDVLLQAIERVHEGHLWFGSRFDVASPPVEQVATAENLPFKLSLLTSREHEVIRLIVEGLRNKAIAERMGVSDKTVQNHLTSIFRKLAVNDRLELAAFAHRSHLLDSDSNNLYSNSS